MPADWARPLQIFCARTGSDFAYLSQRGVAQRYEIEGTDESFDGAIDALRLIAVGKFGNRVWQVLNIMLVARHLGVRKIWFDDVSAMGDLTASIEGVAFARTPGMRRDVPALAGIFFTTNGFETLLKPFDAVFAEETLRLFVEPFFRHFQPAASFHVRSAVGPDVLVMHFRSGEIFPAPGGPPPARHYVLPPAAYYLQAAAFATIRLGVRRVHMVYEDRNNPVVDAVEDAINMRGIEVTTQSRTLAEDVATLLSATHLVAPFGTFCEGIALLSPRLRSLFSFRDTESHMFTQRQPYSSTFVQRRPYSLLAAVLLARGVRLFVGTDVEPGYIPPLGWNSSLAQRSLMLSYPERGIEFSEVAPFVPPPLDPRDIALAAARAETRWLRANQRATPPYPVM